MIINGIGFRLIGRVNAPEQGEKLCFATVWFSFLYLPLFPIRRILVRAEYTLNQLQYSIIKKTPLVLREVLVTYLWGWILLPLFIFWPIITGMTIQALGVIPPSISARDTVGIVLAIIAIVWVFTVLWKLKDWDEDRWNKY